MSSSGPDTILKRRRYSVATRWRVRPGDSWSPETGGRKVNGRTNRKSEAEGGFTSRAGLLGIVTCLLFMGGLSALGRQLWPGLATPWQALVAFAGTGLFLLLIILLQPYCSRREDEAHVADKNEIKHEESES